LVAKGLSSKEIARELGISPSTVDNHIAAVMHQFNLPNRMAIIRFAAADQTATASGAIPPPSARAPSAGARVAALEADWVQGFYPDAQSDIPHTAINCACFFCKSKAYLGKTLLPSLVFALECSVFVVILLMILRSFVNFGF
jgi:hypothetical protein